MRRIVKTDNRIWNGNETVIWRLNLPPPQGGKEEGVTMSNMSYCRFQNTVGDLVDCHQNMDDEDLSYEEKRARKRLIAICRDIVNDYGDEIE
jgi:hypothetical protein